MKEITSTVKIVKELFANTKYNLDYYQREYVWKTRQVKDLLDDLFKKFSSNYKEEHERREVGNYTHYFLGSIITCEKDDKRYIIDGQQRLTTLTLILIHFKRLLENEDLTSLIRSGSFGKTSFNLDIPERAAIMKALYENKPFNPMNDPESVTNIVNRYKIIETFFRDKFEKNYDKLSHFLDWFREKVALVEIKTYADDHAYIIFETMNDRGEPLAPAEMLRGYLLSNITDTERRDDARKVWDEYIRELKQMDTDQKVKAIQAWLSQYTSKVRDFKEISGDQFHRWFRENKHEMKLDSSDDFANFIERDFEFYINRYRLIQLFIQDKYDMNDLECVRYNAKLNVHQYSLMLAPLRMEDSDDEIRQKMQLVATYFDIFIHRRVWNGQNIQLQINDLIFETILSIREKSASELSDILSKQLEEKTLPFASNLSFSLKDARSLNNVRRILARMTDYVGIQSKQSSFYGEYMSSGKNTGYFVEYIWADNFKDHEKEFSHESEFRDYRQRIGGLLLFPNSFSETQRNLPYIDKLKYYLQHNLLAASLHDQTCGRYPDFKEFIERSGLPFKAHTEFKKADLDARQQLYLQLAERIWDPERLKNFEQNK